MFDVYINHYQMANTVVDTETLMFSVPSQNSFPISKPVIKVSEDSADNFSFTMDPSSLYYDALMQMKTTLRVVYDGDIIFSGRVLSISTSTVLHTKNVTCAGVFSYFNDTHYEGKPEKEKGKITVSEFYDRIFNNHNSLVPEKAIRKGNIIGITLPTEQESYEPSSWTQTTSLMNDMTSKYGGHMKIRYEGTTPYLDWYKYYHRDLGDGLRPSLQVTRNILDISSEQRIDDMFTRVIPIGGSNSKGSPVYIEGYKYTDINGTEHTHNSKVFPVSLVRSVYTDQELTDEFHSYKDYRDAESKYGVIYKTISFPDATNQEKLWNEVKKWIKDCYFGIVSSFTVKGIDLHILDNNYPKILLGDCVDTSYVIIKSGERTWENKRLVCKGATYDLFNPENNSYTLGIPSDLLENNAKKSSKATASGDASKKKPGVGGGDNYVWDFWSIYRKILDTDTDRDYEGTACAESYRANGELFGTVSCYDPDDIPDRLPRSHKDMWFNARLFGKITLPGKMIKWVAAAEDKGVFAYQYVNADVNKVTHWYVKHKGRISVESGDPALSAFEDIAKKIEKDPDTTYGGATHAGEFRLFGQLNSSVNCYAPDLTDDPLAHPEYVFCGNVVGKFGTSGNIYYVVVSKEYGIFAIKYANFGAAVKPVLHWYERVRGASYDNKKNTIEDKNGDIYTTDDGAPDGNKTIHMKPTTLTGQGSEGEVLVGYNLTGTGDRWRIKLNYPIQYEDADGNIVTKDGFVSASDFNIEEIPSFKTKLGIFDVVIAGKVDAVDIEAEMAYIRNISGNTIVANTSVRSEQGAFTRGYIADLYVTRDAMFLYDTPGGAQRTAHLQKCFDSFVFSEEGGVITLSMGPADGSESVTGSFNMAATQFYIDAIAAAKNTGWNDSRSIINNSLPSSSSQQTAINSNWNLAIPNNGYNSGSTNKSISVGDLTNYTIPGTTTTKKVVNVSVGGYIAYRKEIPLEDKGTVNPTADSQTITPSTGYYGIGSITIGPNGQADAKNTGWNDARAIINNSLPSSSGQQTSVDTNWNLNIPNSGYGSGSTAKAVSVGGLTDYTIPGTTATKKVVNVSIGGYVAYRKEIPLENKGTISPTGSDQTITPSSGYYGMSRVVVGAAPLEAKTSPINPTASVQTITPSAGYYGMSQVTIAGAPLEAKTSPINPTASVQTIAPSAGYYGMSQVTIAGAPLEDKGLITPTSEAQDIYPSQGYFGISHIQIGAGGGYSPASAITMDYPAHYSPHYTAGGTGMSSWKSFIEQAINNHGTFYFDVYIAGHAEDKKRYFISWE